MQLLFFAELIVSSSEEGYPTFAPQTFAAQTFAAQTFAATAKIRHLRLDICDICGPTFAAPVKIRHLRPDISPIFQYF
uniref:Uncharacterized protein n=1 Tax=Globodera rostochiensis TaxID=31243 RepID=A0A914H7N6_GLORO